MDLCKSHRHRYRVDCAVNLSDAMVQQCYCLASRKRLEDVDIVSLSQCSPVSLARQTLSPAAILSNRESLVAETKAKSQIYS